MKVNGGRGDARAKQRSPEAQRHECRLVLRWVSGRGSVANLSSNEAKWVAGSENDDFLREVVLIPVATIVTFRG